MPLETDLSPSPYFDDFDASKDFVKVLFKPSVPVQVRELNQLQTILQSQIERMGDNLFKRGTIISGCNFSFHSTYPFVKIQDSEVGGVPAAPALYVGYFLKNASNLQAYVINYQDGFESTDPDLKTLYISYVNSGNTGAISEFSPSDTLTVFDTNSPIFNVDVNNGGLNFSNNDNLVISSALIVNVSTGTFISGVNVYSTTATMEIVAVNNTILATSNQVILSVKPRTSDLIDASVNSASWTFSNNDSIRNSDNTVVGTVEGIIGTGVDGVIVTDASGRVVDVTVTDRGTGYVYLPWVTVKSVNNSSGITSLDLSAQNYLATIKVGVAAGSIGNGYAFTVGDGIIYQKGYFAGVDSQTIIVDKYSQSPNAVSVGFQTIEEIIDSNQDISLLDNAIGAPSDTAPGADRLRLTPTLQVLDATTAAANDDFFTLVEWSEGNPFKQNKTTVYNTIGDVIATRTSEESGNYVLDKFLVTTRSPLDPADEGLVFSTVVDPGIAYIDGYRVETSRNEVIDVAKGLDTQITNTQIVSLNYGNYLRVKETGGVFQFSTADSVDFYDTPTTFLSNVARAIAANMSPAGSKIGTARARSFVLEDGSPGTANTVFRLYLFNIVMNTGKNFRDTRAVYYNGTNKGIADVALELDGTTGTNVAIIHGSNYNSLLFPTGTASLKNANNVQYIYRTIDQTLTTANSGLLTKSIASSPTEFYPYSGNLSSSQLKELFVVPIGANLISYANLTGAAALLTTSPNVVGSATTFGTDLIAGDFVRLSGNSTESDTRKVSSVVNNTLFILDSNAAFSNTAATIYRAFPMDVPVPFGTRSGLTANVDANGNVLTVNFGMTFQATTSTNTALAVNIQRRGASETAKIANRDQFVLLRLANNVGGTAGPWYLGVPDIFRLKGVWIGNSTVSSASSEGTTDFYIDHNQNPNFYDNGWLFAKPQNNLGLISSQYLLVKFDYFTSSGSGFYDTVSYTSSNGAQIANVDSMALANLTSQVNSLEIPELYSSQGDYYDLNNQFDFRPYVSNTAAPSTDYTIAPLNPAIAQSFGTTSNPANDKKFPLPDSTLQAVIEEYLPRIDSVFMSGDGGMTIGKGTASTDPNKMKPPAQPLGAMTLNNLVIPAYPNIPQNPSETLQEIMNTGVGNELYSQTRNAIHQVSTPFSNRDIDVNQPQVYTMEEIGSLDRRITDLEYYASLALLNSDIVSRVIPSSIDPSLDRFKFGYFVDDYSTENFSDELNPSYRASIVDDKVLPSYETWSVSFPGSISTAYTDFLLASQQNATNGPPVAANTPKANTPAPANCQPNTATTNAISVRAQANSSQKGNTTLYGDTLNIQMSALAANVTLFFHTYSAPDRIQIYQGNTLLLTSNNAVNLSTTDQTFLKSNSVPSAWFNDVTFKNFVSYGNGYVTYSGKIQWIHAPAQGRDYTINVSKGSGSTIWRYVLQYPISSNTVTCPTPPSTNTPVIYAGTMVVDPPSWQYSF